MAITFEQFMRGMEELRQAQLQGEQEMADIRQGLKETRETVEKICAEFGNFASVFRNTPIVKRISLW